MKKMYLIISCILFALTQNTWAQSQTEIGYGEAEDARLWFNESTRSGTANNIGFNRDKFSVLVRNYFSDADCSFSTGISPATFGSGFRDGGAMTCQKSGGDKHVVCEAGRIQCSAAIGTMYKNDVVYLAPADQGCEAVGAKQALLNSVFSVGGMNAYASW